MDTKVIFACNTAHMLMPGLSKEMRDSLISVIDSTVNEIANSSINRVAILASPATLKAGLYEKKLRVQGVEIAKPSNQEIAQLEDLIADAIANHPLRVLKPKLKKLVDNYLAKGYAVLLGCTDLSLIYGRRPNIGVIDPLDIVSDKVMDQ